MSGQYPDATALQREMFPDIHPTTVCCALCKIGFNSCVLNQAILEHYTQEDTEDMGGGAPWMGGEGTLT